MTAWLRANQKPGWQAIVAILAAITPGCGYHVSGKALTIPATVKTIAVMPFGNATVRYKLARLLPSDITREFISRTHYAIVADPNQADAVLTGALVRFDFSPTIYDPISNRATGVQIVAVVQVTLTDRATGKVLFSRPAFEARQIYEISIDPQAYFDESGTAMERVGKDVARSVVSAILEGF